MAEPLDPQERLDRIVRQIASNMVAEVCSVYVLRAVKIIFWGPGPATAFHDLRDANRTEWGALWILGTALIVFGVWPALVLDFIDVATPDYLKLVLGAAK